MAPPPPERSDSLQVTPVDQMELHFDPMTGEPIGKNQSESDSDLEMHFDPITGEPLQPNGHANDSGGEMEFDPMTGQRINEPQGGGYDDDLEIHFDPMTGQPLNEPQGGIIEPKKISMAPQYPIPDQIELKSGGRPMTVQRDDPQVTHKTVKPRSRAQTTGDDHSDDWRKSKIMDKNQEWGPYNWMPDALGTHCTTCKKKFTFTRRRHHCRFCGQIYCKSCTTFVLVKEELAAFGYTTGSKARVCGDHPQL
eukprot:TRINITY_DN5191_c0_g1_i2.p1 TRINITY_DN5191_c0_g1~~TRINITY_DN5191_c0_g1_i2.p1  ORF type:complete len:262 (+),score=26.46 TRINITY_DN5191_c0_g1_i2:34-786(+)